MTLTVQVASVPDRDALVAEIWLGDRLVAEVTRNEEGFRVQLYAAPGGEPWDVPYDDLTKALAEARAGLGGVTRA